MKKVLFIHGAYHGGWCWDGVIGCLPKDQYDCHAIDLPGHGKNRSADKSRITTKDYVDYILDYIRSNDLDDLYLMSHSLGGITLSKVVELIPQKIKSAIFLTSVILNGKSFFQLMPLEIQAKYRQIASGRKDNSIPPDIDTERIKQLLFYKSENSSSLEKFLRKLEPQPIGPYEDVICLSGFGQTKVPVTYIKCKYDIALPQETFNGIFSLLPASATFLEIEANHEAMFSNPKAVAGVLLAGRR